MPFSLLNLSPTYTIGQAALGGIVFYILQPGDLRYSIYKQSGLIAATSDQDLNIPWGCGGTAISGADGTAIGTGYQNTQDILAGCATRPIAASVAAAHNGGGFNDWYLPSINELNILCQNKALVGGFSLIAYWSSSESDSANARINAFSSCFPTVGDKGGGGAVRAIRSF
jgi:hypothetical protein